MEKKKSHYLRWCKMAKIKWKNKSEIDAEKEDQQRKNAEREKYAGKGKDKLTRKDLDALIVIMAEERGLL